MIRVVCKGCGASIPVEPKVGATTICTRCETPYVVSQRLIDRIAAKAGLREQAPGDDAPSPGFLRVKCDNCGKGIKVTNPRPGAEYSCGSCGHVLKLTDQQAEDLGRRLGAPMDAQQTILQAPRRLRGVAKVGKPGGPGGPGGPPIAQPSGKPGAPGGTRGPGRPGQPKKPMTRGPRPGAPTAEAAGPAGGAPVGPAQAKKMPLGPGAKKPMTPAGGTPSPKPAPSGAAPAGAMRTNMDMPDLGGPPAAPAKPAGGPPKRGAPVPAGALMTDVGMPDLSDLKDLRVTPDDLATPAAPLKRPEGVGRPKVTSAEEISTPVDPGTGQREIVMPSGRKIVVPDTAAKRKKGVEPVTLVPPAFKYDESPQGGAAAATQADPNTPMVAPISPPSELRTPSPDEIPSPFAAGGAPVAQEPVVPPPAMEDAPYTSPDDVTVQPQPSPVPDVAAQPAPAAEPSYQSPIHDEEYVSPLPPPDAAVQPPGPGYGAAPAEPTADAIASGMDAYGGDAQYDLGALTEGLGEEEELSAAGSTATPSEAAPDSVEASMGDSPFMHPSTADEDLFPGGAPPPNVGPASSEIPLQDEFFASEQQSFPPLPAESGLDAPSQSAINLENELADYLGDGSEGDRVVDAARDKLDSGDDDLAALVAEVSAQSEPMPSSNIDVQPEQPPESGSIFDIDKKPATVPESSSGVEEAAPWDADSQESRDVLAQMGLGDGGGDVGIGDVGIGGDSYSSMERYDSLGDFKIDGLGAGADLFDEKQSPLLRNEGDDNEVDLAALATPEAATAKPPEPATPTAAPASEAPAEPAASASAGPESTSDSFSGAGEQPAGEQPFMPSSAMQSAASIQSPHSPPDDVRNAFEGAMGSDMAGDLDAGLFGGAVESHSDDGAGDVDNVVMPPVTPATPASAAATASAPEPESPVTTPEPEAEDHDFHPAANRDEMYSTMMTIPRPAGESTGDDDAAGATAAADAASMVSADTTATESEERVIAGSGGIVARDTRLRRRVETSAYSTNIDHVGVTRSQPEAEAEPTAPTAEPTMSAPSAAAPSAPVEEPAVEEAPAVDAPDASAAPETGAPQPGGLTEMSPSALMAGQSQSLDNEDEIERGLLEAAGAWDQPAVKPDMPGVPSRRAVPADALRSFAELVDMSELEDSDDGDAAPATATAPAGEPSVTSEDRVGSVAGRDDEDDALARDLAAAAGLSEPPPPADIDTMKTIVGSQMPDVLPPPPSDADAGVLPPPPSREAAPTTTSEDEELLPFEDNFELAQTMAPQPSPLTGAKPTDEAEPSLEVVEESVFTPKAQVADASTAMASTPEDSAGAVDEIEEDVELAIGASELNMNLQLPGQRVVPAESPDVPDAAPADGDDDDMLVNALASAVSEAPEISTPEDRATPSDDDDVIEEDVELAIGASELNIKLELPGQRKVPTEVPDPDAPEEVEELDELDELDD